MSRSYPRYRDSEADWVGAIPEHWEVCQVRRRFNVVNGGTPKSTEDTFWDGRTVWLTPDDLGQCSGAWISHGRRNITEDGVRNSSALVSPAGSIILSTRAPIGHLAISAVPAATNQGCRTLVPSTEMDSRYAYYSLLASRPVLQSLGKGSTFMELPAEDLSGHIIALPPLTEQRAIAAFLDHKTAEIDALIARKRLLIERLAEHRTALVTRTVTRGLPLADARAAGLDPNPPLRDSGVEWLGEVPEHWEVRRLGTVLHRVVGGGTPSTTNETYWADEDEDGLPWVAIADMSAGGEVLATAKRVTPSGRAAARLQPLEPGTIIYSMYASVGVVARLGMPAVTNQAILGLRPEGTLHSIYLYWWLTAVRTAVLSLTRDNTQSNLNAETVRKIPLALPPMAEQRAMADCLDRKTAEIDALCIRVEAAIERLQEYRTALVTAAVTGKIDVRDEAHLEAEVEEQPA